MTTTRTFPRGLLLVGLALAFCGCAKSPPPVTEVEGTVLLNNEPLANALVQFMPETGNFGAEANSTGVTNEQGHFTLTCNLQNQSGAIVGKHRVLVTEAPPPAAIRRQQEKAAEFQAKLKNRPIPSKYGSFAQTPLSVEVKPEQKSYTIELTRK
jgi:hypothetical protein